MDINLESKNITVRRGKTSKTNKKLLCKSIKKPINSDSPAIPVFIKDTSNSSTNTKHSQLLTLLQSTGTTMQRMIEVTGWQAHSIRGYISAVFRKKMKLTVECVTIDAVRVYRIAA